MKFSKMLFFSIMLITVVVSCKSQPSNKDVTPIETSFQPTHTPKPTEMKTPTSEPTYTAKPTETKTQTSEPTHTAEPTVTPVTSALSGRLFFDMNRTGVQDESTYYDFSNMSSDFVVPIAEAWNLWGYQIAPGELTTIFEPGLVGYEVCARVSGQDYCHITDVEGDFTITDLPVMLGTIIDVSVTAPHSDEPQNAMRYFNLWLGFDSELDSDELVMWPIDESVEFPTGSQIEVGLVQGFALWPNYCEDYGTISAFFDQDDSEGQCSYWNGPSLYGNCVDNHFGIDIENESGTIIVASAPGIVVQEGLSTNGSLFVTIKHYRGDEYVDRNDIGKTHYGHNSENLVGEGEYILPGQPIAYVGKTGTAHPHIHMSYWIGANDVDFFSSESAPSVWTVWDKPVCVWKP